MILYMVIASHSDSNLCSLFVGCPDKGNYSQVVYLYASDFFSIDCCYLSVDIFPLLCNFPVMWKLFI
jgi:hypothetical protein